MEKTIIKNSVRNVVTDIFRVLSLLAIVLAIVFCNINVFVAIVVGLLALFLLFASAKSIIKVTPNSISFTQKRILNIFSNSIEYEPGDIVDFEYFNSSIGLGILEFIFPLVALNNSERIDIIESDGERTKFSIKLSDDDVAIIRRFIERRS